MSNEALTNRTLIGYPEKTEGYPLTALFKPCNSKYSRRGDVRWSSKVTLF